MKSILLVEDDNQFREALKTSLSRKYNIQEASNGKVARDLIQLNNYDLVISDILMPHFTGMELLDWVNQNKKIPVILMTGFSQIIETQDAHNRGATDFISKPFSVQELIEKIEKIFPPDGPIAESKPKDRDEDFCRVPIDDFVSQKEMEYNLYIRLAEDRYIKIVHKGGKIDVARVKIYKEKGITNLYIKQEDFRRIVGFTVDVAKLVKKSDVTSEKKKRFLKYTGEMIVQNAFVSGIDTKSLSMAKDFLDSSLDVLTSDEESFSLLSMLNDQADFLYAHSLGVSLFSVLIGKQMGWESQQTLFKLAFGGMFHDIGKKEIPKEILVKARSLLNQNERQLLETHASRGKEILESMRSVPTEVVRIAWEHHEDTMGQGYPRRLFKQGIHPLSLVISTANVFCNYTIASPQEEKPISAREAIEKMEAFHSTALDGLAFKALKRTVL